MEIFWSQVDKLLAEDTLPKYSPPTDIHNPNLSPSPSSALDAPNLSSLIVLPAGLTHVSQNVSIFAGHDLHLLLDPMFLVEHSIDQILLLRDQQYSGEEGDLIGTCSRLRIEGVTLVNWDLITGDTQSSARNDLVELLDRRTDSARRIVVCGTGAILIDLAVVAMCHVEQISEFEALLAIKREAI